jgi:hypothetical protein
MSDEAGVRRGAKVGGTSKFIDGTRQILRSRSP